MGMLPSLKQTLQDCEGGGRRTVTPGEGGFGPVGCPSRTPQSPGEQGGFPGTVSGVEALRLLPRLHARGRSWLLCPGRWLTPLSLPGDWRPPCPGHQTPGFTPHSWLGASGRGRAAPPPPAPSVGEVGSPGGFGSRGEVEGTLRPRQPGPGDAALWEGRAGRPCVGSLHLSSWVFWYEPQQPTPPPQKRTYTSLGPTLPVSGA